MLKFVTVGGFHRWLQQDGQDGRTPLTQPTGGGPSMARSRLNVEERELIDVRLREHCSVTEIGREIGRDRSTI